MVWTQRDQIQAYQFLRRRLVSALVAADANHPVSPSRRLVLGVAIGVGAALLVTGVYGVLGVLNPTGDADWRQGGQVIVEQETGARFVLGQDKLLHPVLNFASARLLAGGNGDKTVTVPAATLATVSRGPAYGIPGAPDSLPTADRLLGRAFTSCTSSSADRPAGVEPVSTVILGAVSGGTPEPAGQGLLAQAHSGGRYLITAGRRYTLPDAASITALGYDGLPFVPVADSWLDTVPAGQSLGLVKVDDSGATGPTVGGDSARVGQVLQADNGGFYLVRKDSVQAITQTEAKLVAGNPANTGTRVIQVSTADVNTVPRAHQSTVDENSGGYPVKAPQVVATVPASITLCSNGSKVTVSKDVPLPADAHPLTVDRTDARGGQNVYVPPGSGALVKDRSNAVYLITDTGSRYPVADDESVKALGYGGVTAPAVDTSLLALLPRGPALDRSAATKPAPVN
ncbi:type VII secretion protein EccB [Kutzneria sp. CA-103260]|uniref:type VII secretion protein EccB n=1 Tax=Kutzneria sp. CA-103260 TaxID=2802641 RepID=UPI00201386DE|nr:type VII secretion protein EccB [Kutzneria sp. CA-103260]